MFDTRKPLLLLALTAALAGQGCTRNGDSPLASSLTQNSGDQKTAGDGAPAAPAATAAPAPLVEGAGAAGSEGAPAAATADAGATPASNQNASLKAGLWRVEDGVFDGLVENGKAFICIDAATEALINRGAAEFAADKCTTDESSRQQGLYLGRTTCRLDDKTVVTRTRVDGHQIYFRDVITQEGAVADDDETDGKKVSDYAEWVNACGPDQKPGTAYAQAYGEKVMKSIELPDRLKLASTTR